MEDMDKDHDGYITVDEYISKSTSIDSDVIMYMYIWTS